MSHSPAFHKAAIVTAFTAIGEIDFRLIDIDDRLNDPTLDEWDAIDLEPLTEDRDKYRSAVVNLAAMVVEHGNALIDGWKEHEIENVGRQHSIVSGALARVLTECPGIETHPVFQRLRREAVPF